jgi:hypothetical protein
VDVFLKENPHLERWQVADPEREVKQGLVLPFPLSASLVLHVWSCCLAWDILAGMHAWNENNAIEGSGMIKKLQTVKKEKPHDTILSNVIL